MKFVIPNNPTAKVRHRCGCIKNKPFAYDLQQQQMKRVRAFFSHRLNKYLNSADKKECLEASQLCKADSFDVTMKFMFPVERSACKSLRNLKLWGVYLNDEKPDLDNLEKFYLDCLTKVIWNDDKKIIKLKTEKFYSQFPRTEIQIVAKKEIMVSQSVEQVLKLISPSELKEFLKDVQEFMRFPVAMVDEMLPEAQESSAQSRINAIANLLIEFSKRHGDKLKKLQRIGKL